MLHKATPRKDGYFANMNRWFSTVAGVVVGLERSASGIAAGGRVGGTYGDLFGGTTGFSIVVNTVLHITANAFDVVATGLVAHIPIPSFIAKVS